MDLLSEKFIYFVFVLKYVPSTKENNNLAHVVAILM